MYTIYSNVMHRIYRDGIVLKYLRTIHFKDFFFVDFQWINFIIYFSDETKNIRRFSALNQELSINFTTTH